jgi:hypothetical protein
MTKIMISYRREDSEAITGRIFDRLSTIYGRDALFRDIDSIPPGIDFRNHIANALHTSDIVVIIIGPRWLGRAQGGHSRIDAETDFVRIEVETALKLGISVIPVLIGTTRMPRPEQLPETLRELTFRNAVRIDTGQDFDLHMGRFIHNLNEIIESRTAERDAVEPRVQRSAVARILAASRTGPPKPSRTTIPVGIGLLVLLVIVGIYLVTQQLSVHQGPVPPETLKVRARDDVGTPLKNTTNRLETVAFNAEGTWTAIPSDNTDTSIPRTVKGNISPAGDPNFNANKTPCRAPLGALIVRNDDKCIAYGKQGSFNLEPGETVHFLMNDVNGMYHDNQGSIDVHLSIK